MLAALGGRLFREAFAAENTPEDMRAYLAEHFTEAAFRRVLVDPACHVLVLEDGATPVATSRTSRWAPAVMDPPSPRRCSACAADSWATWIVP